MSDLSISLLGPLQALRDGEPVTDFGYKKVQALLAYLVIESGQPQSRDTLVGLFWPEQADRSARSNLSQALYRLNRALGTADAAPPFVLSTRQTVQFNPLSDYWLDVAVFRELIETCKHHSHRRSETCRPCVERLEQAVALYRDEFLAGLHISDSFAFEEWGQIHRETLHHQALDALTVVTTYYVQRGAYEPAARYARRQIELEPWRETAHRQLMRILALDDRRNAALLQYETCRHVLDEELGIEPDDETRLLYRQIKAGDLADLAPTRVPIRALGNPYKGLHTFREADAADFFGREAFIERLYATVRETTIAAVIGPSGSGKSSVVFAGLLPQLRRSKTDYYIAEFRPGSTPFHHLAGALLPLLEPSVDEDHRQAEIQQVAEALIDGSRSLSEVVCNLLHGSPDIHFVLIADQFEELYTLCPDPRLRRRFLNALLALFATDDVPLDARCSLVLTLRADFMGQATAYRPFADALQDASLILGPMNRQELSRAIEAPAAAKGISFEPGLVARILDDVGEAPGRLPLLEFALTLLWEQPAIGRLTHAAYEAVGQVDGALARYAEEVYADLSPEEQERARRVFVQLVHPGEGTEDTRRPATRAELGEDGWNLVQHLADRRLVVTDRDAADRETAELIHEALIQSWERLQTWMDADRLFRAWQERLRIVVHQWQANGQDDGTLLRGTPLSEAEQWLAQREAELSRDERTFIRASLALRDRRQREQERERAARERLQQQVIMTLAAGATIALVLALLATLQWRRADAQRNVALSNQLASQALNRLNNEQFDLALLLNLEAYRISESVAARGSLLTALQRTPYRAILRAHDAPITGAAFSPTNRRLVTSSADETIILWDTTIDPPVATQIHGIAAGVTDVALSPDGQILASGGEDGTITLWDVSSEPETLRGSERVADLQAEQVEHRSVAGHTDRVTSLAFGPDGRLLASGGADRHVILWDLPRGLEAKDLRRPPDEHLTGHQGSVTSLDFSPDGRLLASGGAVETWGQADNTVLLWDTSHLLQAQASRRVGGTTSVTPPSNGSPSRNEVEAAQLRGHQEAAAQVATELHADLRDNVTSLAFSPDGRILAAGADDDTVVLWDTSTGQQLYEPLDLSRVEELRAIGPLNVQVAFSPDGSTLATGRLDGTVLLWNVASLLESGTATARPIDRLFAGHTDRVTELTFSPDGRVLVSGSADGTVILWAVGHPLGRRVVQYPEQVWTPTAGVDGRVVAHADTNDTIVLRDVSSGRTLGPSIDTAGDTVTTVALNQDATVVATGQADGTITLRNRASGQRLGPPLAGHSAGVTVVAFSPDGDVLASGGRDNRVVLWDVEAQQPFAPPFVGHEQAVADLAFSPDGRQLASGSWDDTIIVWNISSLRQEDDASRQPPGLLLSGHTAPVVSVAFSPDGRLLASASLDTTVRLWDIPALPPPSGSTPNADTAPDPDQLSEHRIVDYARGVWSVAFSPDGETLAWGSDDGIISLWHITTGEAVGPPMSGHADTVSRLAFSADGRTLLSVGQDNSIVAWDIGLASWRTRACNIANRQLTQDEWQQYLGDEQYRQTCPELSE